MRPLGVAVGLDRRGALNFKQHRGLKKENKKDLLKCGISLTVVLK